jgi:hypothetical protein
MLYFNVFRLAAQISLCLLSILACACKQDNVVVDFLKGAERQVETEEQRREIRRALEDLLTLPAADARARRYADYQGKPGTWSATQLLQRYYVPAKPMALDEERFYRDAGTPEARAALERCLDELK